MISLPIFIAISCLRRLSAVPCKERITIPEKEQPGIASDVQKSLISRNITTDSELDTMKQNNDAAGIFSLKKESCITLI